MAFILETKSTIYNIIGPVHRGYSFVKRGDNIMVKVRQSDDSGSISYEMLFSDTVIPLRNVKCLHLVNRKYIRILVNGKITFGMFFKRAEEDACVELMKYIELDAAASVIEGHPSAIYRYMNEGGYPDYGYLLAERAELREINRRLRLQVFRRFNRRSG